MQEEKDQQHFELLDAAFGDGKRKPESDEVNHPAHYCDGGIETLDFILAKKLDFLLGQVVKYVSRAGKKDPNKTLQDLEKAQFYLNRKIELMKGADSNAH